MKVLQINSVCGIGSTGRIATDIHKILVEQGNESYIAYGRDRAKNCDSTIKIGSKIDNYTHVALTRVCDKHGFGSKKATKKFIEKVKVINPDIIHLHNIHGYYINIELLFNYLKEASKLVVWTLHDCWSFTGHCSHFDYINCGKWRTGCYSCPQKQEYPKSMILDNSKNNYLTKRDIFTGVGNLRIVTPSKWLAGLVKESFLSEYPVKVINNGIDLDIFKPTKGDFRERYNLKDKFILLGVANIWSQRKGYKYFLELASKLENNEVLVLVGLTKKQKAELPKNIIGIIRTNNIQELASIYTTANVFVNLTLEDAFSMTNLEALACGIPVITFNTGGSIECVDETTGIIVEKGSLVELRTAINKIKSTNSERYYEATIKKTTELYNKNDRFKEYIKLYNMDVSEIVK